MIRLDYGIHQTYRRRGADITIRGRAEGAFPVRGAVFALNDGTERPLYVEQEPDPGVDWLSGYKTTPAELRCRDQGEFCVEIDVGDEALRERNRVRIAVDDAAGARHEVALTFDWDPMPPDLPLDLSDLSRFSHVQEVGQAVNGVFDLDRNLNVIRSRAPVAPDALLVLGPPATGQEATYAVRFSELDTAKWLGCSDYFAGMTEGVPARGLKVGWSSAGMAALSPRDGGRAFIAWGDHSGDPREWAIATNPASPVAVERLRLYRVRHQIALKGRYHRVRWRIWPDDEPEPRAWLCEEDSGALPADLPTHGAASFGLFQHMGHPIEWSDIRVAPHESGPDDRPCAEPEGSRTPFLKRDRPGAF